MQPDKIQGDTYKQRTRFQVREWANGNPIHNSVDNECCPDFSCCQPYLLQPEEIRKTFLAADEDARMSMLGVFLSTGLVKMVPDKNVFIADGKTEIKTDQN